MGKMDACDLELGGWRREYWLNISHLPVSAYTNTDRAFDNITTRIRQTRRHVHRLTSRNSPVECKECCCSTGGLSDSYQLYIL